MYVCSHLVEAFILSTLHPKGDQSWVFNGRTDGWSLNSNTLATSCEELTHWKRLWCWEGLGAGGEGDDRGWDGWMGSLTRWTWVWVNSGSWWWTGRPGMLQFMGSQRVRHDWATELNWTEDHYFCWEWCRGWVFHLPPKINWVPSGSKAIAFRACPT